MEALLKKPETIKYFLNGFASAFDITGKTFIGKDENELSGFQKDCLAIWGDRQNLGNDMRKAINRVIYDK